MLKIFLALLSIAFVQFVAEILWRRKVIKGEASRKSIQIINGCQVAAWPWIMSYNWIIIISLGALSVAILSDRVGSRAKNWHPVLPFSRALKLAISSIFLTNTIHDIKRRSIGEPLFALGVMALAIFSPANVVFAFALLVMSLSDSFAALIGQAWGSKTRLKFLVVTKAL